MVDLRDEIIALEEESLHAFIEKRINDLKIGDAWKKNIKQFVEEQYKLHPENMETLHSFLLEHSPNEIEVTNLDVTATIPLLLFYNDFIRLYDDKGFSKNVFQSFKSAFHDFLNSRNHIRHYPEIVSEKQRERFIIDQFEAICCIIHFSLLCERNCPDGDIWKSILTRALYLQGVMRRERWLLLSSDKETDISPESDLSDIEIMAETGNTSAQVLLGKMLYEGKRYGLDRDKAFMWFFKAARSNNVEAMYYLGKCYHKGSGVDYDFEKGNEWYKKAADQGFAPAQYEIAFLSWGKIGISKDEERNMFKMVEKSAAQEYPPALWMLGLCYEGGLGVEKDADKARELEEQAGRLGYNHACEQLAEKAAKNGDNIKAKEWYTIAAERDSKNAINALNRFDRYGHF